MQRLGHRCDLFFFREGPFLKTIPATIRAHVGDLADCLRLVSVHKFDVVHAATIDWDFGISAVRRLGAKLILTGHGWNHGAWSSANCDSLVSCCEWNAANQEALGDMPVHVIPNGVDTDRFHPPQIRVDQAPIVGWVGRGSDLHQKQIDRFAQIAPILHRRGIRIWIADPDGPGKIPGAVAQLLSPIAERWGAVAPDQMPTFFQQIAASGGLVLSTSSYEGLSLSYVEAQACGCPIVGADVVGVNEGIEHSAGGELYPPDSSPASVADRVFAIVSNREEIQKRSIACRDWTLRRHSLNVMANAYLKRYSDAPDRPYNFMRQLRSRMSTSPIFSHRRYVKDCWSAGYAQYEASLAHFKHGEIQLAASAVREAWRTSPTLFARAPRAAHMCKVISAFCSPVRAGAHSESRRIASGKASEMSSN
jgi:glycosyltransferase involved in cell wall biosynthesis